jgi:hypothetical protein
MGYCISIRRTFACSSYSRQSKNSNSQSISTTHLLQSIYVFITPSPQMARSGPVNPRLRPTAQQIAVIADEWCKGKCGMPNGDTISKKIYEEKDSSAENDDPKTWWANVSNTAYQSTKKHLGGKMVKGIPWDIDGSNWETLKEELVTDAEKIWVHEITKNMSKEGRESVFSQLELEIPDVSETDTPDPQSEAPPTSPER